MKKRKHSVKKKSGGRTNATRRVLVQKPKTASVVLDGNLQPTAVRGSVVMLASGVAGQNRRAIVCSNDIQNESAERILVAPIVEMKKSSRAPFQVRLLTADGFTAVCSVRCDLVSSVLAKDIVRIEKARVSERVLREIEDALKIVFDL